MAKENPESLLHRGLYRNSPPGRSSEPDPADIRRHHRGPGLDQGPLENATDLENYVKRWLELLRLIHQEYPYCTMYNVHIVGGVITGCEQIQRSLMLGTDRAIPRDIQHSLFDMKWQALEALCVSVGTGRLVELKFHDAKPVIAITKEGGRRFKGILQKLSRA